jgi:hypothetical protein
MGTIGIPETPVSPFYNCVKTRKTEDFISTAAEA